MSSSKFTFKLWLVSIVLFLGFNSKAQETIQNQYQQFYKQSSTWEDYKMIKIQRLGQFWAVVTDTLDNRQEQLAQAQNEIISLNNQIEILSTRLQETENALVESNDLNNSIAFFGMQMTKTLYNIVMWTIIIGLATGMVFTYLMFMRSNSITIETRSAFKTLETQFVGHRETARETQAKLKRELQTAINTLNEQRVR